MPSTAQFVRTVLTGVLMLVTACKASSCRKKLPTAVATTPASPLANVVVIFGGVSDADRPLLLYSGMRGMACRTFEPHVGTGTPSITLVGLGWDPSCPVELAAFAPALGAFARTVDPNVPAQAQWFTDALTSGTLNVPLPPMVKLPVRIWLVDNGDMTESKALRDRQVASVFSIFEGLATGVTLDTSSKTLDPNDVPLSCDDAQTISLNTAIYDASKVNVYYVENYMGAQFASYAYNCWKQGHPEISFVSWGNANTPNVALAHELGHALGLVHPHVALLPQFGGGHTNNVSEFDAHNGNLMMSGAAGVTNVSIGQIYAMNFGQDSWLNRPGAPSTQPVVRACQDGWGAGPCPALTMFYSGWPL